MAESTFVLKLSDGSDIFAELEKLARENKVGYGLLVSGCGKIREFELISHESRGGLNRAKFDQEFELNAISGKIQLEKGGKFSANVRVSISSTGFTPKAGELVKGKASKSLEIGVRKIDYSKMIMA